MRRPDRENNLIKKWHGERRHLLIQTLYTSSEK